MEIMGTFFFSSLECEMKKILLLSGSFVHVTVSFILATVYRFLVISSLAKLTRKFGNEGDDLNSQVT